MELSGCQQSSLDNIYEQLATLSPEGFKKLFLILTHDLAKKMAAMDEEENAMDCYYNTLITLSDEMEKKHVLQA